MSFSLDQETMKKTFVMGDDESRFVHKSGQKIKLFPFIANNNAPTIYQLSGVAGEWFRLVRKQKNLPQQNDEIISRILDDVDVDLTNKDDFVHIVKELFWDENGQIRPTSIDSMCYLPANDSGENKMAQYLFSVLNTEDHLNKIVKQAIEESKKQMNVLERAVLNALSQESETAGNKEEFFTLHIIPRELFQNDLKFVLENSNRTKEHFTDLLEFYYFFYTSQACFLLDQFEHGERNKVVPLYFSLDWEKTNKARECYKFGWSILQPAIENMFYHAVTLELLNQRVTDEQYDYIAIKELITDETENDISEQIKGITELYRRAIISISQAVECEPFNNIQKDCDKGKVFSEIKYLYDSVKVQFENTGRRRAKDAYIEKFRSFCHDKFLKRRGQSGMMLNISEERLIFLTKLAIKNNEQMSLHDVFREFEKRGVYFDVASKEEVVKFYSKLNLIDKKSDSGDAQYVKRFL